MGIEISRRRVLAALASFPAWYASSAVAQRKGGGDGSGQGRGGKQRTGEFVLPAESAHLAALSVVLGRVSDKSVTLSALANDSQEVYYEYGSRSGTYSHKTPVMTLEAAIPVETTVSGLDKDSQYYYRLRYRKPGEAEFAAREECQFHTQRSLGSTFTFGVQGDSHPERPQMSEPNLYARTLQNAAAKPPDFYLCMGDDFSISTLHSFDAASVDGRYTLQRPFLGLIGQTAPVFLLNGNHEQASLYNYRQTDERHAAAVLAQNARNRYFPTVGPDGFYTGNDKDVDGIGKLKDYYAWTWGDALFIVLDNYWHSPEQVDSGIGGKANDDAGRQRRDLWGVTLGEEQYTWFKKALESNKSKFVFVFAHHVLGTQRGGVDVCHLYEWGGQGRNGQNEFKEMRPGWEAPIHDLMVKHGVTIFFQGHDHLYCRQEKDGVVYQEVPMPADHGYATYNADRYASGVKLPNSGHLRVTVSADEAKVEYVRCYLPADEKDGKKTGEVAHTYTVRPRARR